MALKHTVGVSLIISADLHTYTPQSIMFLCLAVWRIMAVNGVGVERGRKGRGVRKGYYV